MEQLLEAFGIDVRLIIIQAVNFGLLLVALTYFLYTPVLKLLKEREEKINQGMKDAEAASLSLSEAAEEKRLIMSAAHKEAEATAARAMTYATEKAEAIVAEANAKAVQVAKDASLRAEEAKTAAVKESEAEIARLAILAAEKVLIGRAT